MFKNTLNVTKADRLIELSGRQEQVPVRQLRCPLRAWEGGVAWAEKCCSPRTEGGNCQPGCEASGDRSSGTPQAGKSQAEGKQAQPGRRAEDSARGWEKRKHQNTSAGGQLASDQREEASSETRQAQDSSS